MGSERGVPILVGGDPGPVRQVLLARGDIEVLWVSSVRDAVASISIHKPKVAILRSALKDGAVLDILQVLDAPSLFMFRSVDWKERARFLAAGATEILEIHRGDLVLDALTRITGLKFAKHRRVPLEQPVRVRVGNVVLDATTVDLSASGLGLRGFPSHPPDTLVEIELTAEERKFSVFARTMRCWNDGRNDMAGLQFVALTEQERHTLTGLIERNAGQSVHKGLDALFGDIDFTADLPKRLRSQDIGERPRASVPPGKTVPPPPPHLKAIKVKLEQSKSTPEAYAEQMKSALETLDSLGASEDDSGRAELARARADILREYLESQ